MSGQPVTTVPALGIVVPALNAEARLAATLESLLPARRAFDNDIVVADGGSTDRTCAIAESMNVRVCEARRGRGSQLAAGGVAVTGDWLLFVHADTVLREGWEKAVAAFIADPANTDRAGYFRFALDDDSKPARRLERRVAWRCRTYGLPYGDQGLLVTRTLYDSVGGFRPLPLMEDVDLVRRIGRRAMVELPVAAVTSAEKFRRDGYTRRSLRNLACLALYFAGVPPRIIARLYG